MSKKIISFITVIALIVMPCVAVSAKETDSESYRAQLSALVNEYSEDNYFETMEVTIGSSVLLLDGEEIPIDNNGTEPYIENGRTMMPVRAIAEAIGADVDYDDVMKKVTVSNDEKVVEMKIDDPEMTVNNQVVMLMSAPEIVNDRTMLPVRDVAEALDCEVSWDKENETAYFTRPLQTKRLIVFTEDAKKENSVASIKGNGFTILQFATIEDTAKYINKYSSKVKIEPDRVVSADVYSWGVAKIDAEKYYGQVKSNGGSAVVAVVDTGIDYSHPYFNNRIVDGYDFVEGDDYCNDEAGHGTLVSSVVLDVAGFNSNIKIMPVRVLDENGYGYETLTAAGIEYAADHGANVINLSLGGEHSSEYEQRVVNDAVSKNIAVVAAAGNDKFNLEEHKYSPAKLSGVITVSALDRNLNLSFYSNYGEGIIDFAAPGDNISGACAGGGTCSESGTSFASPHVAGAYALVMAAHPKMKVDEVTSALKSNAKNLGSSRYFGAGLIYLGGLEQVISPGEAVPSNLSINMEKYPESLTEGEGFGLRGTVESNYKISEVKGYVINSSGDTVLSSADYPGATSMNIKNAKLNNDLVFNNLAAGKYTLKVVAKDTSGKSVKWERDFSVISNKKPQESSTLSIDLTSYPTSIKRGSSFGLRGSVTSNYKISSVLGYVINSSGVAVLSSVDHPDSTYMDIRYANLNNDLVFNNLSAGSYTLRVVASDASGKKTEISKGFSVVEEEKPVESTLTINLTNYPSSINRGNAFGLRGSVTSNYKITSVLGYVINSSGSTVLSSADYPNSTSMDIRYARLNEDLIFNNLSAGDYTMKVVATDASGKKKEWSAGFSVVGTDSNVKTGTINIPSSWDNLSIRTGPGTDYPIVGSMNQGEHCKVYTNKTVNGWYYVEYNGITGYASGRQIILP